MVVIGLTGGSGSGKTTALGRITSLGGRVVDCDAVYHTLLEENSAMLEKLLAAFPAAFAGGRLDRKQLGQLVFGDGKKLQTLNGITHPFVVESVRRLLEDWRREGCRAAAIDAIALLESGLGTLCDYTVAVLAPASVRLERLMVREGISQTYAQARIEAQKPDRFFIEQCQYVLYNDGDLEEFAKRCDSLFLQLIGGTHHE